MPKPQSSDFQPCPAGNQLAVCARLVDLGTQETTYKGKPKQQRKLFVEFQVPGERNAEGDPFTVSNRYTFSSHEKATLRKHLESWRGKRFTDDEITDFELRNILGKAACLTIVHTHHNGTTYADLTNVAGLPKGSTAPTLEGETVYLSLDPDDFEPNVFQSLTAKLQETIAKSPEYRSLNQPNTAGGYSTEPMTNELDSDGIPF